MASSARSRQTVHLTTPATVLEPSLDSLIGARDGAHWVQVTAAMCMLIAAKSPRGDAMRDDSANVKFRIAVYLACLNVSIRGETTVSATLISKMLEDQKSWLLGSRGQSGKLYLQSLSGMVRGNDSPPLLTEINRLADTSPCGATATEAHAMIRHNTTWINFGMKLTSTYTNQKSPRAKVWQAWWQHISSVLEILIQEYKEQNGLVNKDGKENAAVEKRMLSQGGNARQKSSTTSGRFGGMSPTAPTQETQDAKDMVQATGDARWLVNWAREVQAEVRANAILDPVAVQRRLLRATESTIHTEAVLLAGLCQ